MDSGTYMQRIIKINIYALLVASIVIFVSCSLQRTREIKQEVPAHEIATSWADMTLRITQYTPSNSPTYASRCLGYIGLTMYESVVAGDSTYRSLQGQLTGLGPLPRIEEGLQYSWPASLNAAQAWILKALYRQTSEANMLSIDSLQTVFRDRIHNSGVDPGIITRSESYGRDVARQIFEWSKEDGGHRGYLHNFDKSWSHPEFPGSWRPPLFAQSFSHHPLHPHWGSNRCFVPINNHLATPEMIPYSEDSTSAYYQQFLQVYEQDKVLTQEQKEAAIWWGDDPDDSFTPPGHSYFIAKLIVDAQRPDLVETAKVFAQVGLAVSDAFVNCWKWKYHHFTERANTYIVAHIDKEFESFWPDPPFPAFPSGHAIQASAAASILIANFGNDFAFIDSSNAYRPRDEVREVDFVPRHFTTIWDVARETANSRFYGGIHIPHDNEVGLREGARIAQHVLDLGWYSQKEE